MPIAAAPPNLRDEMCGPHRKKPASETEDESEADTVADNANGEAGSALSLRPATPKFSLAALPTLPAEPIEVFVGAPKQSARVASGAATGAKPVAVTPVQTASAGKPADVKAGTAPAVWTTLTPTPLANAPPPSMSTVLSETPSRRAAAASAPRHQTEAASGEACRAAAAGLNAAAARPCHPAALCRILPKSNAQRASIRARRGSAMERIWLKDYPPGVPADIDPSRWPSLVAMMEESFCTLPRQAGFHLHGQDAHLRRARRALA